MNQGTTFKIPFVYPIEKGQIQLRSQIASPGSDKSSEDIKCSQRIKKELRTRNQAAEGFLALQLGVTERDRVRESRGDVEACAKNYIIDEAC